MSRKFKIGDVVRIKRNTAHIQYSHPVVRHFLDRAKKEENKTGIVHSFNSSNHVCVKTNSDDSHFFWDEDSLEFHNQREEMLDIENVL